MMRALAIAIVLAACAAAPPASAPDGARPLDEHHATHHRTPSDDLRRAAYVRYHMARALDDLRAIHRAIVLGDVDAARAHAALVARPVRDAGLARWADDAAAVTVAANAVERAPSANAMAALATACRACHVRVGATHAFPTLVAPAARHGWAIDRMLDGIVGDDDRSWRVGIDALDALDAPAVHAASARTDRGRAYAEVLAACAACHARRPTIARGGTRDAARLSESLR